MTTSSLDGSQAHQSKLYYELSHLYDKLFTRVFSPRIERVIRSLEIEPGAQVLEVGAGTGLSFGAYPSHCQVTGIDLAPEMLEQAQEKIARNGWRHLKVLEMDALNLKFADNTFDYVMAFHVVSVVPDVRRLMQEVLRVSKPGGAHRDHQPLPQSEPVSLHLRPHDGTGDAAPGLAHPGLRGSRHRRPGRRATRLQDESVLVVHHPARDQPQAGAPVTAVRGGSARFGHGPDRPAAHPGGSGRTSVTSDVLELWPCRRSVILRRTCVTERHCAE